MRDTPDAAQRRSSEVRAASIVLAVVLILLAPALLRPGSLIYPAQGQFTDLTITHWPAFEYLRDALRQSGAVPLWRTSILSGTPFAADPVTALWYPPNWLAVALPLDVFFKAIVAAHLFLGGWGMMRLARAFGATGYGAAASGVAYAIAPRVVAHASVGHLTLVEAWAWMPFMVWAARRDPSWRGGLASGALLGLCALADLRLAVYAGLVLILYVLVAESDTFAKRLSRLPVMLLAAALISAASWLPALALAGETTRASLSAGEAAIYSLPGEYLLGTLLPLRGDAERLTYVGLAVIVLAFIGVRAMWRTQRRAAAWLIALAALGVVGALGANVPLVNLVYQLPGLSLLRVPARAWFMVAFVAALACGLGIEAMMHRIAPGPLPRKWKWASLSVAAFALLLGVSGAAIVFAGGQASAAPLGLSLIGLAVFLPIAIGLIAARASGRLPPVSFAASMLLLIVVDLVWVGWGQYRVVSQEEAFSDGSLVAAHLRSMSGNASISDAAYADASYLRVYSPSYSVPQHVAQAAGLELADGIAPMQLARTVRFMQTATGVGPWGYSVTLPAYEGLRKDEDVRTLLSRVTPDPALLGLLNVQFVVAHFPVAHPDLIEAARVDDVYVYENARVLPRARVVGRVDVARSQDEAMAWLASHDLEEEAVVEGGHALNLPTDPGSARIELRQPDRILVSARGPGLLVLSEVYEREWRATVDGQVAEILPTDGVLRGVYLPAGAHQVEFVYDPPAVKLGVGVSAGGALAGWLVGGILARRRSAR